MKQQRNSLSTDILYISHGGGPLPLLGDPGHQDMVKELKRIASELRKPAAIVVVSAHWEEPVPTITSAKNPSLIYDYSGFPKESYEIEYPAPGHPELAAQLANAFGSQSVNLQLNEHRGFDHGLFVPLKIMYPEADIPCVQLSLVNTLNAEEHLALGKQLGEALQNLALDNVLVIGSGFSFHNMRAFFTPETPEIRERNQAFEDWLRNICTRAELSESERHQKLAHWEQAPSARFCHPREEHLLPLYVCYGIAGKPAEWHSSVRVLGKNAGFFYWSRVPVID